MLLVLLAVAGGCKRAEQTAEPTATAPATTAQQKAGTTATGTEVGAIMPAYSSTWLDGSPFELASKRDKVVLLNVWATWCGPCRYEIPELQAIHNRYADQGFEVIGVSVDESGADAVKQFVAEQKMTYPVVLDAEGKLATLLDTSVLPTSVIIDRTGKIVWKKFGAIMPDDPELKSAIESALGGATGA